MALMSPAQEASVEALASFVACLRKEVSAAQDEDDAGVLQLYLDHAARLLEKMRTDGKLGHGVGGMERLFGTTFIIDAEAYDRVYAAWSRFADIVRSELGGMTGNERLFADIDRWLEQKGRPRS
jgi:hypothetical protein